MINTGGEMKHEVLESGMQHAWFVGGRWGFIDRKGEFAIEQKFDGANGFSDGLAGVKVDDKWGFIDKSGTIVIEPQFDGAWGFVDGLAYVWTDRKSGYINKKGEYVWSSRD